MSTDISKVYLFLAQQGGILAADKNGDGYVIKSEFREFMEDSYEWDGETTDAGKNDLINTFWKSIDTNQSGKISGTRLKNKNAIDKKEMEAMNVKLEIYEKLNEYLEGIEAPTVVNDQYAWKRSLSESLSYFVENYIKQGGKADKLEEALNKELPAAKARTTADYAAKDYIEEVLSDISNYARSDDKTLKGIIDKYIAEIKKLGNENLPSDEEIVAKVKELVDAYLATAKIGEGDVADLAGYGYSPEEKSAMNDLQKAVLMTEALSSVKADAEEKAKFDMSNDGYKAALQDYIDSLKYADFENLQGSILENFKNSSFYTTIQEKVDAANLEKARNEAIKYCDSIYNKGELFKSAVEQIFGSDYKSTINGMEADSIASSLEELKNIVASYDVSSMTQAEKDAFFYGISSTYTLSTGENKTLNLANTATCNGNIITTDRISYKATGVAQVDTSGKVTLNATNPGTFSSTLAVFVDGKQIASKTIIVTVNDIVNFNNDDKTTINGETVKNIMLSNNNIMKSGWVRPGSALATGKTFIISTLDNIQTSLISGGYNESKTKEVIDILKQYYITTLEKINSNYRTLKEKDYDNKGIETTSQGSFSFTDSSGKSHRLNMDANWKEYKNAYEFTANEISCASGFGISHQRKGDDNYSFYFNTKSLLNMFKAVYDSI